MVLFILAVLLGASSPFLAKSIDPQFTAHYLMPPGTPVRDTVFSDLVSDAIDPVIYPGGVIEDTEDSIRMISNYDQLAKVNETMAVQAALNFAARVSYLEDVQLTLNPSWTLLDGATWSLQFTTSNMRIYFGINALSARVSDFSPRWEGITSPHEKDSNMVELLDDSALEMSAKAFLIAHNYSLSQYARYAPPHLEYSSIIGHEVSMLRFFHVVDDVVISTSGRFSGSSTEHAPLQMGLDIETGEVIDFFYKWTHVSELPKEHLVNPAQAERIAIDHLQRVEDRESANITAIGLVFGRVSYEEYRLNWIVYTDDTTGIILHIDAVSAEIFSVEDYVLATDVVIIEYSLTASNPVSPEIIFWMLPVSLLVSILVWIGAHQRLKN